MIRVGNLLLAAAEQDGGNFKVSTIVHEGRWRNIVRAEHHRPFLFLVFPYPDVAAALRWYDCHGVKCS